MVREVLRGECVNLSASGRLLLLVQMFRRAIIQVELILACGVWRWGEWCCDGAVPFRRGIGDAGEVRNIWVLSSDHTKSDDLV